MKFFSIFLQIIFNINRTTSERDRVKIQGMYQECMARHNGKIEARWMQKHWKEYTNKDPPNRDEMTNIIGFVKGYFKKK